MPAQALVDINSSGWEGALVLLFLGILLSAVRSPSPCMCAFCRALLGGSSLHQSQVALTAHRDTMAWRLRSVCGLRSRLATLAFSGGHALKFW